MKYYLSGSDPLLAVYIKDGLFYPVFTEKYGDGGFPLDGSFQEISDPETLAALDKYMQPYESGKTPIYMAGPLFNEGDRYTNRLNSDALRALGYTTFLPQEIVITTQSPALVRWACFYMDLKAIRLCDCLVVNCNGIDIDSGTAAEIGLGYGLGKRLLLYKSDVRNYFDGEHRLNNFVSGLAGERVCRTTEELCGALAGGGE